MKNIYPIQWAFIIAVLCLSITSPALSESFTANQIEEVMRQFRTYDYADDPGPTCTIEHIIRFIQDKPQLRAVTEREMIALLESDATVRAKQFVCHQLWIIATDASIPVLEKMLLDKETAEMACYALRSHPSQAATRILREALSRVDNRTKIRILTILGDKKDPASVDQLIDLLEAENADIVETAAISLGTIGTEKGVEAIQKARATASGKRRTILTRAWFRCAECYTRSNRVRDALAIYETLFNESEPLFVRRAALVSAINTGHIDAVKLISAAIEQENPMLRAAGISNSYLLKGPEVTDKLISAIDRADSKTHILLVEALGRRKGSVVIGAVTKAARHEDINVRMAAYNVLADIGDASSAALMCSVLNQNPDERETETILACLRRMSADGVNEVIMGALNGANGPTRSHFIRVISDRRYRPAVAILYGYTDDNNPAVAKAALRAIGTLARCQSVPNLVRVVLENPDDAVSEEAVRAIITITRRGGYEQYVGQLILERLEKLDALTDRCRLMPALAAAPGEDALQYLQAAAKNSNARVRDCAVRMLADYPEASAASILLNIYEMTQNKAHRMLALRGLSRLCKTADIPAEKAVQLCRQTMGAVASIPEEKLILSTLAEVVHPGALQIALDAMQRPAVKTEASLAVVAVAEKLMATHPTAASDAAKTILNDATLSDLHPRARQITKKSGFAR